MCIKSSWLPPCWICGVHIVNEALYDYMLKVWSFHLFTPLDDIMHISWLQTRAVIELLFDIENWKSPIVDISMTNITIGWCFCCHPPIREQQSWICRGHMLIYFYWNLWTLSGESMGVVNCYGGSGHEVMATTYKSCQHCWFVPVDNKLTRCLLMTALLQIWI